MSQMSRKELCLANHAISEILPVEQITWEEIKKNPKRDHVMGSASYTNGRVFYESKNFPELFCAAVKSPFVLPEYHVTVSGFESCICLIPCSG